LAEPDRGAEAVPEAANDASRGSAVSTRDVQGDFWGRIRDSGRLGWLLLGLVAVAVIVLVVAEFSTISYRTIGIGACSDRVGGGVCRTTGHESHGFALLILSPVALVMAWGAVVGRSRAAAFALASLGAVVLVLIALAIDYPKLDDKRGLDTFYNDVTAHTGAGYKLELVGGVLLLLAGGLAVFRPEPGEERAPRRPRPTAEELAAPPPPPPEPEAVVAPEAPLEEEPITPEPQPRPKPRTTARSKSAKQTRGKSSKQRRPPRKPGADPPR
jgi:tryptophan-associated transmembrane protein